jgi:hypothetical protein
MRNRKSSDSRLKREKDYCFSATKVDVVPVSLSVWKSVIFLRSGAMVTFNISIIHMARIPPYHHAFPSTVPWGGGVRGRQVFGFGLMRRIARIQSGPDTPAPGVPMIRPRRMASTFSTRRFRQASPCMKLPSTAKPSPVQVLTYALLHHVLKERAVNIAFPEPKRFLEKVKGVGHRAFQC